MFILVGQILQVELIGGGFGISDLLATISLVISFVSVGWVFYQNYRQKKTEKMRLIVSPHERFPNVDLEVFYVKLALSNESSLPISILNMHVYTLDNNGYVPDTENNDEGGSIVSYPIEVKHKNYNFFRDYQLKSNIVPLTIAPYSSIGAFVAFHAGASASFLLPYRELILEIETSRGLWSQKIDLSPDNFNQYSYDGSVVFGKAVMD